MDVPNARPQCPIPIASFPLNGNIKDEILNKTPENVSTLEMVLKIKRLACTLDVDLFVGIAV